MIKQIAYGFAAIFLGTSYKYLPFVYFIRFYAIGIKYIKLKQPVKITASNRLSLFGIVTRKTYCCPLECDFFGFHKNNGTYQTELDLNRTECILNKLNGFFHDFKKKYGRIPYVPLATYSISFLKDIKPFQRYSIDNRILTWDGKWIFTLSLIKVGERVVSISVGKLVFKDGRKTIPPQEIIEACGYACDEVEAIRVANLRYVNHFVDQTELLEAKFE